MGLMAATVVSLVAAFVLGDVKIWAAHGLVVMASAAYLAGLRRLKKLALERRRKVSYLPAAAAAPAPPIAEARGEVRQAATR